MAFLQVSMMARTLGRTVPFYVILPTDKISLPGMPAREDKPYKTLYLLHGVLGSCVDWVNGTRIQRFAEENDLAVVMPSGDNAFYLDHPERGDYYGEFIGRELVEQTRKMFPLSCKREDTFIGGLSMGGYGALRNGLKYSETFGRIVALSSALILEDNLTKTNDAPFFIARRDYAEACFGDLEEALINDRNPEVLVRQIKDQGKPMPEIFMACGDKDGLLPANDKLAAFLEAEGVPLTYKIGPGAHEWDFWDTWIRYAITEWLPLEKTGAGRNSGNVN